MEDSPGKTRDILSKILTLTALSVGVFIGVSLNVYNAFSGVFSPQARVASQNDRINGAVSLFGSTAFADVPACSSCNCHGGSGCGCSCSGGCGGGGCGSCGCGGCGA